MPATSDADIDMHSSRPSSAGGDIDQLSADVLIAADNSSASNEGDDDDSIFNTTLLGPVRFWGQSPKDSVLQPSIELLNFDYTSDGDTGSSLYDRKGKKKQASRKVCDTTSLCIFYKAD